MNSKKHRLTFFVSVGCVGVMFLFYFISLQNALTQNKGNAAIINVAGRQRMFSQKITQLSLRLFYDNSGSQLKDKVTQQELSNTLSEFSTVHYSL
ncbi:MAG: type IV pili methyl-accepting chemotaxis transducer N-terminal domain-containing protein, partial [Mameliella sp.]|nr:type IV pili methyl-accepting chemotaxis transducer N-terminal domain-containing protein [Phaeodactylibacter sp.]